MLFIWWKIDLIVELEFHRLKTVTLTWIRSNTTSFPQGGPGHLYLLKNKVATFAKVEKEEDMIQ